MTRITNEIYLPGLRQPAPMPDGLDAPFWEGTLKSEIRVQKCLSCETHQWGPEWMCHSCNSMDIEWVVIESACRIYSWQRPHHPVHSALKDRGPYIIVVVEFPQADGLRMVGNLLGDSMQDVVIGSQVTPVFEQHLEATPPYALLQWEVA